MEEGLIQIVVDCMNRDRRDPSHLKCVRELVVFGSYAAGLNTAQSDIDVLCVGNGRRLKSHSLDLLWVSEDELDTNRWLGSELAGHISAYGIWVRGDGLWRNSVFGGAHAIERKRRRIISLSKTAVNFWSRLHSTFQGQYDISIRRELQRLELLLNGTQIPPTKVLDDKWCQGKRDSVFNLRSSMAELRAYEKQSNVPGILKLPA